MKKVRIISISVTLIGSVLAVIALFLLSSNLTEKHNSFLRLFPPHPIFERDTFNIKYNSYYIAGASDQTIYLGNHVAPLHVLVLTSDFSDTVQQSIHVISAVDIKFRSLSLKVDSPYFYLSDGTVPAIFKGRVDDWRAHRITGFDSAYFTDLVPASSSSFFLRSLSSVTDQYILGKESLYKGESKLTFKQDLLQKQIDGKFCVDGSMAYNQELNRLVYTYYYRNQFLVMDSNLNLLYEGRTIDTVSRARLKIASVSQGQKLVMAEPPLMVNKRSSTSGNWLLVHSNLLARNEDIETFRNASVIDVYSLNDSQYQFSFYIHDFAGEKMKFFYIKGDRLVVLFERHIMLFGITPKYLDMKDGTDFF